MNFFIFRKIIIQFTFICIPIIFIFFPIKIVDDTIIAFLKNEYGKDTIKNIVSIGSNLIYITLALAFFSHSEDTIKIEYLLMERNMVLIYIIFGFLLQVKF